MSSETFRDNLKQIYEQNLKDTVDETLSSISMQEICNQFETYPNWCIGPISKRDDITFKQPRQWDDPTDIGWKSGFLFNPSLIEHEEKLFMFYRAAPKKEALCSRIGLAIFDKESGWTDCSENPLIFSEFEDEIISVEDPKIYKYIDEDKKTRFIMYYNGVAPITDEIKNELIAEGTEVPSVVCNIKATVSDDLIHWEKIGIIVPHKISRYWAKAAVIPRDTNGYAVKINEEYLMYLSEGCGGKQVIGRSKNLINWTYEPENYLDIGDWGEIYEVACAVTDYMTNNKNILMLDLFYKLPNGTSSAAQALYDKREPFKQLALNRGGTLSWGGIIQYDNSWIYAQGWDALPDTLEMYFYTAPINKEQINNKGDKT